VTGKKKQSKQKNPKHLWQGVFNGQRQVYYLYCYAYTLEQARILFCKMIAKKQGVADWLVLQYFAKEKGNFKIKLEVEWRETNE